MPDCVTAKRQQNTLLCFVLCACVCVCVCSVCVCVCMCVLRRQQGGVVITAETDGRYTFMVTASEVRLRVHPVMYGDEGRYGVTVSNIAGSDSAFVDVNVVGKFVVCVCGGVMGVWVCVCVCACVCICLFIRLG